MNIFTRQNRMGQRLTLLTLFTVLALSLLAPFSQALAETNDQEASFSEAELAQMLAPIALYPDSLLTHILIASTYPLELVQAKRLQGKNNLLPTEQLMEKAKDEEWDPSVTALLAFPTVLEKLSEDLEWTQDLGDAFLQDEERMLTAIQTLRHQADEANSLAEMENMQVSRVDNQIIIEPAQKEVVYVPYYDPRVVYGHWAWYNYPPVYWAPYPYYVRPPYGHFYWHRGVHISFNYYFSAFHWHKRHVVVVHHKNARHYRHHGRIVTSHGAQRWHHKPVHRRGVAYRSPVVKHRYNSHRPSTMHTNQVRKAQYNTITRTNTGTKTHSKAHNNTHNKMKAKRNGSPSQSKQTSNLSHYNKQVVKQREQKFANQMHHNRNMQSNTRTVNKHESSKYKASNNQHRAQTKPVKQPQTYYKPSSNRQTQTKAAHKQYQKSPSQVQQTRAKPTQQPSHSSNMRSSNQSRTKSSNQSHSNSRSHTKQRD
ncbi:DUF3300 domain-containing protein [Shewanella eurypsychrophilus]|uniref:DUF3300 domain-containing protein n=1 Tax=Shewanella eurypsychrophilus TaxID=2593656 RepID=A0ABX6V8N1_9GAMM|nr:MULTISPECIES: DUF3300 domain-containing protein [Shewanella]QFU23787.1 DUF3300 domain-containing protein [Shewanella sp. YLB-09]QPG59010.1 DUF3300 domain-containing protein [Shewanella eurypsychrophilus]